MRGRSPGGRRITGSTTYSWSGRLGPRLWWTNARSRKAHDIRAEEPADGQIQAERFRTALGRKLGMQMQTTARLDAGDYEPTFPTLERLCPRRGHRLPHRHHAGALAAILRGCRIIADRRSGMARLAQHAPTCVTATWSTPLEADAGPLGVAMLRIDV